jgi:hypothetical protein
MVIVEVPSYEVLNHLYLQLRFAGTGFKIFVKAHDNIFETVRLGSSKLYDNERGYTEIVAGVDSYSVLCLRLQQAVKTTELLVQCSNTQVLTQLEKSVKELIHGYGI